MTDQPITTASIDKLLRFLPLFEVPGRAFATSPVFFLGPQSIPCRGVIIAVSVGQP